MQNNGETKKKAKDKGKSESSEVKAKSKSEGGKTKSKNKTKSKSYRSPEEGIKARVEKLKPFQFKKGWKGGPGRPKGNTMNEILIKLLNKPAGEEYDEVLEKIVPVNYMHKVVAKLVYLAAEIGELKAIKEVFDRIDGKAIQRTELTGQDGDSIEIKESVGLRELSNRIAEVLDRGAKGIN